MSTGSLMDQALKTIEVLAPMTLPCVADQPSKRSSIMNANKSQKSQKNQTFKLSESPLFNLGHLPNVGDQTAFS